jgi:PAS domain S-box-containing protein
MNQSKILVVDDEQVNVEVLKEMLSKDYDIVTAHDGKEALNMVKTASPDLVLLDIMMPGINGNDVCRKLKNDDKNMSIPIVMVTALKEREDWIKAIEAGADDFLSKPVDINELSVRVRSLIRIKKYHDALMEEQEKLLIFKSSLDIVDDCVIVTNTSGDIKFVNSAFEQKFGYSRFEISFKHISIISHPESTLSLDKESLMKNSGHSWKGNMVCIDKRRFRLDMCIKSSPIIKEKRQINLVFVLREKELVD